jgi:hypothetical protein
VAEGAAEEEDGLEGLGLKDGSWGAHAIKPPKTLLSRPSANVNRNGFV